MLGEGGYFAHLQTNKEGNSIYFLLKDGDFSAWHRLKERETWVVVAGDPLELHLFNELENSYVSRQLKRSPGHLSYSVEPGVWMAATTRGRWSLVLCYLAPAFQVWNWLVLTWCTRGVQ
ncbi:MAG: cupin domain-containing protein [Actinomycetota bacterium]